MKTKQVFKEYEKARRVIQSCDKLCQLKAAKRYAENFCNNYLKKSFHVHTMASILLNLINEKLKEL